MIKKFEEIIVCTLILCLSFYLELTPKIKILFKNDFKKKEFCLGLIMTIIFLFYVIRKNKENKEKNEKIIESVKKSIMALVIAYLAHLDLIFIPFWLVFILSFFFHDWV